MKKIDLAQLKRMVERGISEKDIAHTFGVAVGTIKSKHPGILKVGRPARKPTNENIAMAFDLAGIWCTEEDMQVLMCVPKTTFIKWKKIPEFADAIKKGRANGRSSLLRKQWTLAKSGSVAMCIWLGKNYAGQTDNGIMIDENEISTAFDTERILGTCEE